VTQDVNVLLPLINTIKWVNAFHFWRDADFSLLFHASLANNKVAVHLLIEAGADPTLANIKGTNVFMLFAKQAKNFKTDLLQWMMTRKGCDDYEECPFLNIAAPTTLIYRQWIVP